MSVELHVKPASAIHPARSSWIDRLPPTWKKLLRDLAIERERVLLMGAAIGASLLAIGVLLGGFQILSREVSANYEGTNPAWATLELEAPIGPALLDRIAALPKVADVQARDVVVARVRVGGEWRPLTLFVSPANDSLRINRVHPDAGAWPEPPGSILLERTSVPMMEAGIGDTLEVRLPRGGVRRMPVAGLVHDPGLSPSFQERQGYGYASAASMAAWGEAGGLHELRVVYDGIPQTDAAIQQASQRLARDLGATGLAVHEIRVPRPHAHPHQAQMTTMLLMMVCFAFLALGLSSILAATTISAILVRQRRELGILKSLGADTSAVLRRYATAIAGIGLAAFLLAWVPARLGALAFARALSRLLNIEIGRTDIPWSVWLVVAAAAIVVPLAACWMPMRRASSVSPREAMDDHEASAGTGALPVWLPVAFRDALRRPWRLAMSVLLVAAAGAMFLTAWNIRAGWIANLDKIWKTRSYDVEVRFLRPVPFAALSKLSEVPGIVEAEPWGFARAAFSRPGLVDVVRTWPDRSHGSLLALAPPLSTRLVDFPLVAGRRLRAGDGDGVVLSHVAWAQAGRPAVGARLLLSLDGGARAERTLHGVVEEVGSPGIAYLTPASFARDAGAAEAASMVRVRSSARSPEERAAMVRRLEQALVERGLPVEMVIPFAELRTAVGDHILILVRSLVAMAAVMGLVGMLGLAAVVGMNVLERTREIGTMKALGATPGRLVRRLVLEALAVTTASWFLGIAASVPLTIALDRLIGSLGFLAPLPFVISWHAIAGWAILAGTVSLLAAWVPARRGGNLSVREALQRI